MSTAGSRGCLQDAVTLRHFLDTTALPALVLVADRDVRLPLPKDGVDLRRPVLLYRDYSALKIHARSVGSDDPGPAVVIPDRYRGWFSLVSDSGLTAPCYGSVGQVVAARVTVFLSRHNVPAYIMSDDVCADGAGSAYRQVTVGAGNVLRLMGVFQDINTSSRHSLNYAQCVNYKNQVMFVPLEAEGQFYAVTSNSARPDSDHVCLTSQILRYHRLPVTVKLVCGYMPRMHRNFTGLVRLEESHLEHLILGCTASSDGPSTLFELRADSSMRLVTLDPQSRMFSSSFDRALVACERYGDSWRNQIKVIHNLYDEMRLSSDTSPSTATETSIEVAEKSTIRVVASDKRISITTFGSAVVCGVSDSIAEDCSSVRRPSSCVKTVSKNQCAVSETEAVRHRHLTKSLSLDGEKSGTRSLRQTVSRFLLNRSRCGNTDVTSSFVFTRPAEMLKMCDKQTHNEAASHSNRLRPGTATSATPDNIYAEIGVEGDVVERLKQMQLGDVDTLQLGSDGQSSSPSSPGDTMEQCSR